MELGCGHYSTLFLHWYCFATGRKLITLESKPDWFGWLKQFEKPFHEIRLVDFATVDLSGEYGMAFVDHHAGDGRFRADDARRLTNADFVVCHDTENGENYKYKFNSLRGVFKNRWKYTAAGRPFTSVYSNKFEVKDLI